MRPEGLGKLIKIIHITEYGSPDLRAPDNENVPRYSDITRTQGHAYRVKLSFAYITFHLCMLSYDGIVDY
jgi:hypothetical protein